MCKYAKIFSSSRPSQLIIPNISTNWLHEVKIRHVNVFCRVEQLHLFKLQAFTNSGSSTHSVDEKWPVEIGFIVAYHYVQVYPLGNSTCVHTCK